MTSTPEVSCPDTPGLSSATDTPDTPPDRRRPRLVRSPFAARTERPGRISEPAHQQWAADMAALLCEANQQADRPRRRQDHAGLKTSCPAWSPATGHLASEGSTGNYYRRDPHRRRRRPPVTPVPRLRGHDPAVRHQPRHRSSARLNRFAERAIRPRQQYKCVPAQAAAGGRCRAGTEPALVHPTCPPPPNGASTNSTHLDSCSPDHGSHPHLAPPQAAWNQITPHSHLRLNSYPHSR